MTVTYEKRDRVAIITINRPEVLNAINQPTSELLAKAWADFRDDNDLWVAILTGAGERAFSAGADLKAVSGGEAGGGGGQPAAFGGNTRGMPIYKPMIAAINGLALGGGLEMALTCDIRIAADTAILGLPETRWSLIPGAGGTQRLMRAIPIAKAMEVIMMAHNLTAQEALQYGLVNKVVPQAEVLPTALAWADEICQLGPLAVRAVKESMLRGASVSLEAGLDIETSMMAKIVGSEDMKEGPRAFAEKRKPNFKAR